MSNRQYSRDPGGKFSHVNSLVHHPVQSAEKAWDEHPGTVAAVGTVGAVAGVKGVRYGQGARMLRAAAGHEHELAHYLNRAYVPERDVPDLFNVKPHELFGLNGKLKAGRDTQVGHLRNELPEHLHKPLKGVQRGVDRWADTYQGQHEARRVNAGKVHPLDLFNFEQRPTHKLVHRVVEAAEPNQAKLYRGMGMAKKPKVGDEIHLDQTSWTEDARMAAQYAERSAWAGGPNKKVIQGKHPGAGNHEVILHLPEGKGRAVRTHPVARTVQSEHLAPAGKYRVTHIDENGHTHVERIDELKKRHDPFGIEEMVVKNLTQDQIDRRKKAGAAMSRTTSTIGLGSLAALGASAATKKYAGRGVLRAVDAGKAAAFHGKTKDALITTGIVSSGIGGLNGFNNASWQSAEAKQRHAKKGIK